MAWKHLIRYPELWRSFTRSSLSGEMTYRGDFIMSMLSSVGSLAIQILFFGVIFLQVDTIGGWTAPQVMVLIATTNIVSKLFGAFFGRSVRGIPEMVRLGNLDFLLLYPVNTHFMMMTRMFSWQPIASLPVPIILLVTALINTGQTLTFVSVVGYLLFISTGVILILSIYYIISSLSIWLVRVDAFFALWSYICELIAYPDSIYRGFVRFIFMTFIPIILIANIPSRILLGDVSWLWIWFTLMVSGFLLAISLKIWQTAFRFYTSAGT